MIFKVSRSDYAGGDAYVIRRHADGLEFYQGPSIPDVIYATMVGRAVVYFDWAYDEATHSVSVTDAEVPAPSEE